jgi:hypothetical protein
MNATNLGSSSAPNVAQESRLIRTILVEPLLVIATGTFWLVALPLVGISLGFVKIWDAFGALSSSETVAANPLILRKYPQLDETPAFASSTEIWASSHI